MRFAHWMGARRRSWIDAQIRGQIESGSVASENLKRSRAVSEALEWTVVALTYFIASILALDRLGIPLTTLVAPATVIGIGLGFGAQQMVGDLLAGFFLFAEHQFGFGDVIRLSVPGQGTGITGTVEELTLRVTKVRTAQGELVVVPNSALRQVTNLSKDWSRAVIDIPVPVTEDPSGSPASSGRWRPRWPPTRTGAPCSSAIRWWPEWRPSTWGTSSSGSSPGRFRAGSSRWPGRSGFGRPPHCARPESARPRSGTRPHERRRGWRRAGRGRSHRRRREADGVRSNGTGHRSEAGRRGPWGRRRAAGRSGDDEVRHSALVGFMSVPVHRRFPIRRSTLLMLVAFLGFGTLLYLYPPTGTTTGTGTVFHTSQGTSSFRVPRR